MKSSKVCKRSALSLAVLAALLPSHLIAEEMPADDDTIEEITVVGRSVSYANNATDDTMLKQQTSMTSVLATIDNLPGVLINEGDTFGADDWSTSISIRGFQVDLSQQQIGMTVDGIANGNSNYGGGAKANRYIDTENLRAVEVSQGTADIASRSNEALGGTLNFTTINPSMEQGLITSATFGEFDAQKFYARFDTGEFLPNTYAWFSASMQESSDFMQQAAENWRDHYAAKLVSYQDAVTITAYASYDDTHEDNYQRIYGLEQFKQNPNWDGLTAEWTGIPYVDQVYRKGWSTLRENIFAYIQADFSVGNMDFMANVYYHDNEGRGDWVPQYVVDVTDDMGAGHSELISGNTVYGGAPIGSILFVDSQGNSLSPIEGCESSITFPYGGAGAEYDPQCYAAGAIPVGSYRTTNYGKERIGFNGDFVWNGQIGDMDNMFRAGIWWEDYNRDENRSWQKIIDSKTSYEFDRTPYWVQYSYDYQVDTVMYYLENELDLGFARVRVGAKQFNVDIDKKDIFVPASSVSVSSDSDVLLSAGFVAPLMDGLELFGGYAENFAAVKDAILDDPDTDYSAVEPETAENIDIGLRYSSPGFNASVTYYDISFDNRIIFVSYEEVDGVDYLEAASGQYQNQGGIESTGLEASAQLQLTDTFSVFGSYTYNDSEYTDTGAEGTPVIGAAEDMYVLSVDYQADNYIAGLSAKYVGERPAGSFEAPAYTVADFYLGTSIDMGANAGVKSLDVRLTINNITDKSYLGTIATNAGWLGAPRTAALNVSAAF